MLSPNSGGRMGPCAGQGFTRSTGTVVRQFHRPQFGDRMAAPGDAEGGAFAHLLEQLREPRLGLKCSDLIDFHANQSAHLVGWVKPLFLRYSTWTRLAGFPRS